MNKFAHAPRIPSLINLAQLAMLKLILLGLTICPHAIAFPWMADMPGLNEDMAKHMANERSYDDIHKRQNAPGCYAQSCCPNNPKHPGAAPLTSQFPYLGAKNGLPATLLGNILVPAAGDDAHAFEAPGPLDIRGPCPGLNTMANHHVSPKSPPHALLAAHMYLQYPLGRSCANMKRSSSAMTASPTCKRCSTPNKMAGTSATILQ